MQLYLFPVIFTAMINKLESFYNNENNNLEKFFNWVIKTNLLSDRQNFSFKFFDQLDFLNDENFYNNLSNYREQKKWPLYKLLNLIYLNKLLLSIYQIRKDTPIGASEIKDEKCEELFIEYWHTIENLKNPTNGGIRIFYKNHEYDIKFVLGSLTIYEMTENKLMTIEEACEKICEDFKKVHKVIEMNKIYEEIRMFICKVDMLIMNLENFDFNEYIIERAYESFHDVFLISENAEKIKYHDIYKYNIKSLYSAILNDMLKEEKFLLRKNEFMRGIKKALQICEREKEIVLLKKNYSGQQLSDRIKNTDLSAIGNIELTNVDIETIKTCDAFEKYMKYIPDNMREFVDFKKLFILFQERYFSNFTSFKVLEEVFQV